MPPCRKATVLHITKATGLGGSEKHLLDLLPALREAGFDARLCLLESPSSPVSGLVGQFEDRAVPVCRLRINSSADLGLVWRLRRLSARADIVHTHLIHADIHGGLCIKPGRRSGPRLVTTIHSERRADTVAARAVMRYLTRRFDRCIVISGAARAAAKSRLGFLDAKIELIHYGVHVRPRPTGTSPRRGLVTHSRLSAGKNVDDVVRAFALLADPNLTLAIAGDGEHRGVIEGVTRCLGVESRVTMLGQVEDVWPVLHDGEIWISLSDTEGFGLALVEALGAGLPVICTDIQAHREVAAEAALFVPVGDIEAAAHALRCLLREPSLRNELSWAGRARASELSVERMVACTAQVYRDLLSSYAVAC